MFSDFQYCPFQFLCNSSEFLIKLQELSSINELDLLSIRTFYRKWIHSKASKRRCLVISIGPDPILNKLEGLPSVCHWSLSEIEEFRQNAMTPILQKNMPKYWFDDIFECLGYDYHPPSYFEQTQKESQNGYQK